MSRIAEIVRIDRSIVIFNGLGDRIFAVAWVGKKVTRECRVLIRQYLAHFKMSPTEMSLKAFPWLA